MSDIKVEWQKKWREALGEPTDSMPDYREDYCLQFDIWNISKEKLAERFSIFPNGEKIFRRVDDVRKNLPKSSEIDDQALIQMLNQMNRDIESVLRQNGEEGIMRLNAEKSDIEKLSVYRGNETLRREVLKYADTPLIHLDDELCEIVRKYCGDVGYEAFFFLSEPLYQLSGCYYSVSHWIMWAMVEDEFDVDPYRQAYELYKIRAQAGWSNEELLVYIAE